MPLDEFLLNSKPLVEQRINTIKRYLKQQREVEGISLPEPSSAVRKMFSQQLVYLEIHSEKEMNMLRSANFSGGELIERTECLGQLVRYRQQRR